MPVLIPGWEWYPWEVQRWILGVGCAVAVVLTLLFWLWWYRPLDRERRMLQETEAYQKLVFEQQRQRISDIASKAQLELLDVMAEFRIPGRTNRPGRIEPRRLDDLDDFSG